MKKQLLIPMLVLSVSCSANQSKQAVIPPALSYSNKVGGGEMIAGQSAAEQKKYALYNTQDNTSYNLDGTRASLHFANTNQDISNLANSRTEANDEIYRSTRSNDTVYQGSLPLGDPGVTASLWRSSQKGNNLYQDDRAFQPYDLITILITENSEGRKQADTEVTTSSSILTSVGKLLGYEEDIKESNPNIDLSNLISGASESEYTGEGETLRRGSLRAAISAIVVEVLPGGVMRIEGEKIISVNNEEQVLQISGLVRSRDINARNEVNSNNVSQLRVDYYGKGSVGSAQSGGWLSNIVRSIWPF
jgi:flagellar L-ring protein precursor FlgH